MKLGLDGQRVLITGSSKGIGLAIARCFAREGARTVLVARDRVHLEDAADALEREGGLRPELIEADLSRPGANEALAQTVGEVDILVNNAGAIPGGSLHDITEDLWRHAWDLKVYSYINLTRAYLKLMEDRGRGVIVNIIGMAGAAPRYDYVCGSTANAALIAFTQAVGGSSVMRGVRVFGINPAPTRSDRMHGLLKRTARQRWGDESRWPELTNHYPFGRLAEPDEIAHLAVLGASPVCGYLSGTVINVDGGFNFADPDAARNPA